MPQSWVTMTLPIRPSKGMLASRSPTLCLSLLAAVSSLTRGRGRQPAAVGWVAPCLQIPICVCYIPAHDLAYRLETKQRAARKAAEEGKALEPRWFKHRDVPMGEGLAWEFRGDYFNCRAAGDWAGCRDIFGE